MPSPFTMFGSLCLVFCLCLIGKILAVLFHQGLNALNGVEKRADGGIIIEGVDEVCDVFAHIDSYMSQGAKDVLGLGCDLDGTDLPDGFEGIFDLYKIADICLSHGYSDEDVEKIFYRNYYDFLKTNFK